MNERADPVEGDFVRCRILVAGSTLVMIGMSWPLWVGGGDFPQVPFVRGLAPPIPVAAWALAAVLVGALLSVLFGWGGRWAWGTSSVVLVALILGDQDRLQPWVQQYWLIALAVVGTTRRRALDLARWYVVVLYAASGLSKLDAAFIDELGATFLRTIGHLVGLRPEGWSRSVQAGATLLMPVGEVAVAVALAVPSLRRWGLVGSVVQHLATIAILGPWGLNHSGNVLIWNAAVLLENLVLFSPRQPVRPFVPAAGLMAGVLVVALVALERWGYVDSWPSHALYASHAERSALFWPDSEASRLPPSIRRWLEAPDDAGERRLDLTGWSRAARGVPLYPQNRVACGIAAALVERYSSPSGPPVRVIFWGRAGLDRKTPRTRSECISLAAVRRRADRFWINARPAPGFGL